MKEAYIDLPRLHKKSKWLIVKCNEIIEDFMAQGYVLTLRQLYYQLVARNLIPNKMAAYDNLGHVMNSARLAGLVDWDAIEDRTRGISEQPRWKNGQHLLEQCVKQYHQDMWETQEFRVFVIVEKEALAGILDRTCRKWDVPLLSARGYPSVSALREIAKYRMIPEPREIVVLHLGDHDPSGIDMSRDLLERFELLTREEIPIEFVRLGLNMDQIKKLKPPPNPAKQTDSRFKEYAEKYGDESWELDALSPAFLDKLVEDKIQKYIDHDAWEEQKKVIENVRSRFAKLVKNFNRKGRGK